MNKNRLIILFTIILIVSLVTLVNKIFTTSPIQVVLESGEEITTQDSNYYTLGEVVLLIVSAFLIGLSAAFIYYNSNNTIKEFLSLNKDKSKTILINSLLKANERLVFQQILNSNDGALQNELVSRTGMSKVKITRIIHRLERKGLIVKERHGLTNKIKVKNPESQS